MTAPFVRILHGDARERLRELDDEPLPGLPATTSEPAQQPCVICKAPSRPTGESLGDLPWFYCGKCDTKWATASVKG